MPKDDSIMVTPPHVTHVDNKEKMSTIKQPGKKEMFIKGHSTSHNILKIIIRKTILKVFSTSTYIMA
jgi:hypothetical protein